MSVYLRGFIQDLSSRLCFIRNTNGNTLNFRCDLDELVLIVFFKENRGLELDSSRVQRIRRQTAGYTDERLMCGSVGSDPIALTMMYPKLISKNRYNFS